MTRASGVDDDLATLGCAVEHAPELRAARQALEAACISCAERESALRRNLLCRCPIALACRLLLRSEQRGLDVSILSAGEQASLAFQERALRPPPVDADRAQVRHVLTLPLLRRHPASHGPSCLVCRAGRLATVAAGEPDGAL